jgi:hypothetical protein
MLSSRDDLYADVYRIINRLKDIAEGGTSRSTADKHRALVETTATGAGEDGQRAATKPSAVGQRVRQLFLSPVGPRGRRYHPKIVASAIGIALATVAAIVLVANHKRASNQELYLAYVLEPIAGVTGANVYAAPNTSAPVVANLPLRTGVYIVCVAVGNPVEGPGPKGQPRQTTAVWDKVRSEATGRDLGFIPDAWVNTNGTAPVAPNC